MLNNRNQMDNIYLVNNYSIEIFSLNYMCNNFYYCNSQYLESKTKKVQRVNYFKVRNVIILYQISIVLIYVNVEEIIQKLLGNL